MSKTVLIVGGGITGATLAYRLSKAGWAVTVLDAGRPNATQASFGWINASFYLDAHHHRLRAMGIAAWKRLLAEVELDVAWSGCLCWDMPPEQLAETHTTLQRLGYEAALLETAEIAARTAVLREPPDTALWFPFEGALQSQGASARLLDAAKAQGARVLRNVVVEDVVAKGAVVTSAGRFDADQVILAAGTAVSALAETMGAYVPLVPRPAYILRTSPYAHEIGTVLASPIGEIRQEPGGGLLMPVAVNHQGDTAETLEETPQEAADAAMVRLRRLLKGADDLEWIEVIRAERPVPQDGFPVVGQLSDGVYVACFHSGITLAPVMAELMVDDLTGAGSNSAQAMLAPYRPARFASD